MEKLLHHPSTPDEGDVLHLHRSQFCAIPEGCLQLICRHMPICDLLRARLVSKEMKAAAATEVNALQFPFKEAVNWSWSISQVFPNVHGLTLSSLADATWSTINTQILTRCLSSHFGSLRHLALSDFPVALPNIPRMKLGPLGILNGRLSSLELRLIPAFPQGCSAATVQRAQAILLSELPALQSLTSLHICLLDLSSYPVNTPPLLDDTSTPTVSSISSHSGYASSVDTPVFSTTPSFNSSEASSDAGEVNVDLEEAQHRSHETSVAFLLQLPELRVLQLERCCMRSLTLQRLCSGMTPNLERLTLMGNVALTRSAIRSIESMSALQSLTLGPAQLLFEDDEDCPESVMSSLYGCLAELKSEHLSFTLDTLDNTRWLHTAYTLGLHAHTSLASQLRSLELSTVIFDCDYSLMIFAEITALTSLKMTYQTWPLSLGQEDLKLLSPLRNLRRLQLLVHKDEEQQLLSLTRGVLAAWQSSFVHLTCLHFSGLILFENGTAPELAAFSKLQDLSLSASPDLELEQDAAYFMSNAVPFQQQRAPAASVCTEGVKSGGAQPSRALDRESFRVRAVRGASHLGWSLRYSPPRLACWASLPPQLTHLSLAGFVLTGQDCNHIAGYSGLRNLQLSYPGLRPEHLLLTNTSCLRASLEVLVLCDSAHQASRVGREQPLGLAPWKRRPAVPPWRLWCDLPAEEDADHKRAERDRSDPYATSGMCREQEGGAKSSGDGSGSASSSISGSVSFGSLSGVEEEENVGAGVCEGGREQAWWVQHEAALLRIGLHELGQLRELKHVLLTLPYTGLPCNQALGALSSASRLRSLTCITEDGWGKDDVLAALGRAATGLQLLRVLPEPWARAREDLALSDISCHA